MTSSIHPSFCLHRPSLFFFKLTVTCLLTMTLFSFFGPFELVADDELTKSDPSAVSKSNSNAALAKEIEVSVKRSLPYIAERGEWWIEKKDCMSCHRVSFLAWSHIEAHHAGIEVDSQQLNQWIDWCHENLFEAFPEADQKYEGEQTIARNLSGAAQMLALQQNWSGTVQQKKRDRQIVAALLKGQQESGSFQPKGQLPRQKRELEETGQVITIWNTLALMTAQDQYPDLKSTIQPAIDKALKNIASYEKGKSSEWLALRMRLADAINDAPTRKEYSDRLFGAQNPNGGWGWIVGEKSDALATGQIVYLLDEVGVGISRQEIKKAARYLLDSQTEKGLWKVNGTKTVSKARPQETSNYWGTTWATIALCRIKKQAEQ